MLKKLTRQYIEAFNRKDIKKCAELFSDNFALEDSVVKRIEGKEKVLEAIKSIFNSCDTLSFNAKNIYQDNQTTIIEWQDGKMQELRAYLDIPKG